jgi:hypothetical protein
MSQIVLGVGTSHSPVLTLDPCEWHNRAAADRRNLRLSLKDGRYIDYETLVSLRGEPYGDVAVGSEFELIGARCQGHLDRIAEAIAGANLDVIVVVGDDQSELYSPGNIPAIGIFWGREIVTHSYDDEIPDWMKPVAAGYGMDETHTYPGHSEFAGELIRELIARDVDLAIAKDVPHPEKAGFGHAFGFPAERLFMGRPIPMVPVMLNTYYPPNVLSAARCHDIGVKIREAIAATGGDLRVGVLASGGLSHFVVEEELDRQVMDNLGDPTGRALRAIPREALLEGSSEILNWVMTAGAVSHLPLAWSAYEPIRRTPAGTGIGCGFAIWSETLS